MGETERGGRPGALDQCARPWCFRDGVAYVYATVGASARITVVTGPRAAELAATPGSGVPGVRCLDCALDDVQAAIERGGP